MDSYASACPILLLTSRAECLSSWTRVRDLRGSKRNSGPETLMAPRTVPEWPNTGVAIPLSPNSSSP